MPKSPKTRMSSLSSVSSRSSMSSWYSVANPNVDKFIRSIHHFMNSEGQNSSIIREVYDDVNSLLFKLEKYSSSN